MLHRWMSFSSLVAFTHLSSLYHVHSLCASLRVHLSLLNSLSFVTCFIILLSLLLLWLTVLFDIRFISLLLFNSFQFITPQPIESGVLWWPCLSFCLFVSMSPELHVQFPSSIFACVTHVRSSILLWRCCDTLCTSDLLSDVNLYVTARFRWQNGASIGSSVDLSPWLTLKLTHQGAAPDWWRSLISAIALFMRLMSTCTVMVRVWLERLALG